MKHRCQWIGEYEQDFRTGSSRQNMMDFAEAFGGRFVVEAIGRKGILVRLTVKRESLVQPQPDLFA